MEPIDQLATEWAIAKEKEDAAKAERIDIEEKLLKLHPAKEEGSESFSTPRGAKITLTGRVTYKVDIDKLTSLTAAWPDDVRPVKTKIEADETRLKAILGADRRRGRDEARQDRRQHQVEGVSRGVGKAWP